MKCELCHMADAETVLHLKKDGQDRELYVCKKCAAAARHPEAVSPAARCAVIKAGFFMDRAEHTDRVRALTAALVALLKEEKYDVDHTADGASALSALESGVYDIAVLDVMMPEMNGFEVARRARSGGITTPILMLTAKSQLDDKVEGLDSGADDYLTKPFQAKELLARLRALGRRSASFQDGSLRFGDLSLDTATATLTCEQTGQSVRLGEKELRILEYMFSNQGQIMTREQLAVKIWGFENEAEYNNVEVYMSFTRKKLAFVGSGVEIKAVRGLGYELREKDV